MIQLGEDGRNLALSEGVVEGVINLRLQNAQALCGISVDVQIGVQATGLLVAGHVLQLGQSPQLVH